jgi:hypothetical protein
VQAIPQQGLRARKQFPRERDHQVGAVPDLRLLGFGGVDDEAGRRVFHFQLGQDGGGVRGDEGLVQVVDDDLFHAWEREEKRGGEEG